MISAPALRHAFEEMRIDEAERPIAGERDALAGRRQAAASAVAALAIVKRRGARHDGVEVEMAFGHLGQAVEQGVEIGMLAGLNQTEMTFRQRQRRVARHGAEDRNTERRQSPSRRGRDADRWRRD